MMTIDDAWKLATQYYQVGQFAATDQVLRYILDLSPNDATALNGLARLAIRECNWRQAIDLLRRASQANPGCADYWIDLGVSYGKLGCLVDAAAACEKALLLRPNSAVAANNLGQLYQEMGETDRAIAAFQKALREQPAYVDAHVGLAGVLKEQGLLDQAVIRYREALRIQPDNVHAYYALSQLAVEGKYSFTTDDLQRLRSLLGAEELSEMDRSVAGFALGNVLDAQASYEEAFACFQKANQLRWTWQQNNKRSFDADGHRALVDEAITTFDHAYFQRVQGWGMDSELPIFILGMPRSGTTLVEQILASHPAVYGAGELGEFIGVLKNLGSTNDRKTPKSLTFANRDVARQVSEQYLRRLIDLGMRKNATRVTDKDLANFPRLGLLATLFPRARVIHCRRDPRDVCFSCYIQNFQYMDFSCSLEEIAYCYGEHERLIAHWRKVLPIPIHEIQYEDLLANQEHVTRALLSYCGLDWDDRCLTFYNTRRIVRTASAVQVRKPLSKKPVGRWKNYQAHLRPLLEALKANQVEVELNIEPTAVAT